MRAQRRVSRHQQPYAHALRDRAGQRTLAPAAAKTRCASMLRFMLEAHTTATRCTGGGSIGPPRATAGEARGGAGSRAVCGTARSSCVNARATLQDATGEDGRRRLPPASGGRGDRR